MAENDKYLFHPIGYYTALDIAKKLGLKRYTVLGWINKYNIPNKEFKYGEKTVYKFSGVEVNKILKIIQANLDGRENNKPKAKETCKGCLETAILIDGLCKKCLDKMYDKQNKEDRLLDMYGDGSGCYNLLCAMIMTCKTTIKNYVNNRDKGEDIYSDTIKNIKKDIKRAKSNMIISDKVSKAYLKYAKEQVPELFS